MNKYFNSEQDGVKIKNICSSSFDLRQQMKGLQNLIKMKGCQITIDSPKIMSRIIIDFA